MPLPTILTAGQLAQIRQPAQAASQYLLLTPNTVVWQTQPSGTVDGAVPYAEFGWSGTDQGARANVRVGMTVIFSTTTDYRATGFFRGRVRKLPGPSLFYINETSANLTATDYVTVLADYDLHERLERRLANGSRFVDWDLSFTRIPPTISNLQSVYADTSGDATVSLSFAPTVTTNATGTTISTYLWEVGDGTITSGTSTSKDITVSFPGAATNEHRWVRFTVVDSVGTIQYFVFEVYTVDLHDASPTTIKLGAGDVQISSTFEEGPNASIRAWSGMSAVLNQTRCTIVSVDDYNGVRALAFTSGGTTEIVVGDEIEGATSGAVAVVVAVDLDSGTWAGGDAVGTLWVNAQSGTFSAENLDVGASANLATIAANSINTPLTQNVAFVGRLRMEEDSTRGDEVAAQLQDERVTIEGFAAQLSRIIGPGLYLENKTAITGGGQVVSMTVGRALIYMLAWQSTFLNLCSFTMPSDIHDYDWVEYSIPPAPMLEWVHSVSDDINAYLTFAASGECTLQRHASYASPSGLDTILDFELGDFADYRLEIDYATTNAQAIVGAASYQTTEGEATVYQGRAPAQVYGPGWELAALDQQILKSDLSGDDAKAETGVRVANHLAFVNPKPRLTCKMRSGLYWLVPTIHQLYTFNITASDNTGGRAYTTDDKWLCVSVDYFYRIDIGAYDVSASFELVTQGGNYGITVTEVPNVSDLTPPDLPPLGAGLGPTDPLLNYPIDDPDYELPGWGGGTTEPDTPDESPVGCDQFSISMKTGVAIATKHASVLSAVYVVQAQGDGIIADADPDWAIEYNFAANEYAADWSPVLTRVTSATSAVWSSGSGYQHASFNEDNAGGAYVRAAGLTYLLDCSSLTVTKIEIDYQWVFGSFGATPSNAHLGTGDTVSTISFQTFANRPPNGSVFYSDEDNYSVANIDLFVRSSVASSAVYSGSVVIKKIRLYGSGDQPAGHTATVISAGGEEGERGDSFFHDYQEGNEPQAYNSGSGLLLDASDIGDVPVYNSGHTYQFIVSGTGAPLQFNFEDGDYSDNSNSIINITICGEGMSAT